MNNASSIDITKRLYNASNTPYGVLLVYLLATIFLKQLKYDEQSCYVDAISQLTEWWPNCQPSLFDIYQRDIAACWVQYNRLEPVQSHTLAIQQKLLTCLYIDLVCLRRFEARQFKDRKDLPNDVNDIGLGQLVDLVQDAFDSVDEKTRQVLQRWMQSVEHQDWSSALATTRSAEQVLS